MTTKGVATNDYQFVLSYSSTASWNCIASDSTGDILIAGSIADGLFLSTNTGSSWSLVTYLATIDHSWMSVASSSNGQKLAAAYYQGGVFTSANGGSTWVEQNGVTSGYSYTSIASSSSGSFLALVANEASVTTLYTSQDSGSSWDTFDMGVGNAYCIGMSSTGEFMFLSVYV